MQLLSTVHSKTFAFIGFIYTQGYTTEHINNKDIYDISIDFHLQVALRIRPLKHEESARGYKAVAAKIDSKVGQA